MKLICWHFMLICTKIQTMNWFRKLIYYVTNTHTLNESTKNKRAMQASFCQCYFKENQTQIYQRLWKIHRKYCEQTNQPTKRDLCAKMLVGFNTLTIRRCNTNWLRNRVLAIINAKERCSSIFHYILIGNVHIFSHWHFQYSQNRMK